MRPGSAIIVGAGIGGPNVAAVLGARFEPIGASGEA